MKVKITSGLILTLFIMQFISCRQNETEWKGNIEKIDGVKIVKNPMEPMYGEITLDLEEDLTIDDKDGIDYFFEWPCDLDIDNNGNIYVVDQRQHKVYVFDKLA